MNREFLIKSQRSFEVPLNFNFDFPTNDISDSDLKINKRKSEEQLMNTDKR